MSYEEIDNGELSSGETVSSELLNKVKNNLDDLNNRLIDVEVGGDVAYPPITFEVYGKYGEWGTKSDVLFTTVNFAARITGIRLLIITQGSGGTTEIDIKRKRGAGSFTSVLSTRPSLAHSAGAYALSSNGVVNPSYELLEPGDILKLDLILSQTGTPKDFLIRIDYVRE